MNHLLNGLNELMLRVGIWMQGASAGMAHTAPKSSPWGDGWSDMSMHSDDLPSSFDDPEDPYNPGTHAWFIFQDDDEDNEIIGLSDD